MLIDKAVCTTTTIALGRGDNRAVTELSFAHITTTTWAYSRVLDFSEFFLAKKTGPPPPKSLFDNAMGNPFLTFWSLHQNAPFFLNCYYIGLYQKTAFGLNFDFGKWPTGKCMKVKMCVFIDLFKVLKRIFLVWSQ